jgi:hypothetical protein
LWIDTSCGTGEIFHEADVLYACMTSMLIRKESFTAVADDANVEAGQPLILGQNDLKMCTRGQSSSSVIG